MRDRDYQRLAKILDERGKVYVRWQDGFPYLSLNVYSRNIMLIDQLVRSIGTSYMQKGGTYHWRWSRREELHKHLPHIIPLIEDEELKGVLHLVWYWVDCRNDHIRFMIGSKLSSGEPIF